MSSTGLESGSTFRGVVGDDLGKRYASNRSSRDLRREGREVCDRVLLNHGSVVLL